MPHLLARLGNFNTCFFVAHKAVSWLFVVGLFWLSVGADLVAQASKTYVSFSYREVSVREVMADLENRYAISFSYQPNPDLLSYRLSARSGLVELSAGLQRLLAGSAVEYRIIRGQVALRYNRRLAEELLRQQNQDAAEEKALSARSQPAAPSPQLEAEAPRRHPAEASISIPVEIAEEIPWLHSPALRSNTATANSQPQKQRALAQLSIFPGLSTHPRRETDYINTISINLPIGISGGLAGAELGLVFNGIIGDMEGVQLGAMLNTVSGKMTGLQIAGLLNGAGIGTGVQIAGLGNYCRRTLEGLQIAPLLNVALNGVGRQFSLGVNISEGDVRSQIGLLNRGQNVARYQIGLVNISDTIAGTPIALFNFVRRGYNTFELARTSTLPLSISLRLGAHRFYNIFEFGGGRRDLLLLDGTETRSKQIVWGIGYGFGWMNRVGNSHKNFWNTEIVGMHLNRSNRWENSLNFVLSTRITYDWKAGKETHLFVGPVMNLHWTEASDEALDKFFVSAWQLFSRRYDKTRFRGVLGIRMGLRIGKH